MIGFQWALLGTGFICLMTVLGASSVFLIGEHTDHRVQRIFLGFAAGIMIAASVWSLLIPAIEEAEKMGVAGWIPAGGGLILGGFFMLLLDSMLPYFHPEHQAVKGIRSSFCRTTLLVFAVTLHNIPEGMAVGLAFALAAQHEGNAVMLGAATALALGIGIQNFPEGAAIALPLQQEGMKRWKAFLCGALSGIVEPFFGLLTVLAAKSIAPYMPWLLSFAAGAMIYVVVEELIPEANLRKDTNVGTLGVMAGFLIMMVLDVALG